MKFIKKLVLLAGLIALLVNVACLGPPAAKSSVPAAAAAEHPASPPAPDAGTREYINGWTPPQDDGRGEASGSAIVEGDRERMVPNETDEYKRAWTLPDETGKKTAVPTKSQAPAPPASDTDEFINGWTFE